MDAATSGAATTSTVVPALVVAPAPCAHQLSLAVSMTSPSASRLLACPAPCGEAVVPGGVDDFPEARPRLRGLPRSLAARQLYPGGVDDFPEARLASAVAPPSADASPAECSRPAFSSVDHDDPTDPKNETSRT